MNFKKVIKRFPSELLQDILPIQTHSSFRFANNPCYKETLELKLVNYQSELRGLFFPAAFGTMRIKKMDELTTSDQHCRRTE